MLVSSLFPPTPLKYIYLVILVNLWVKKARFISGVAYWERSRGGKTKVAVAPRRNVLHPTQEGGVGEVPGKVNVCSVTQGKASTVPIGLLNPKQAISLVQCQEKGEGRGGWIETRRERDRIWSHLHVTDPAFYLLHSTSPPRTPLFYPLLPPFLPPLVPSTSLSSFNGL